METTNDACLVNERFSCFDTFNRTFCPLRIAVDSFPPWIEVAKSPEDTRLTGVLAELLNTLSLSMKIEFLSVPTEETFREEMVNGTWNGIIGSVHRKEADLGLVPSSPTQSAFRVVDFTQPYHIDHLIVLSGIPERPPTYANVFQPQVWLGLAISFVVLLMVGFFVDRAQRESRGRCGRILRKVRIVSGKLLNRESSNRVPPSYSATRFLMLIWLVASSIIALQCVNLDDRSESKVINIESVDDLASYPEIKVLAPKGMAILKWLLESRNRKHRMLGRRMKAENDSFLPAGRLFSESSLDAVERRESAIVAESSTVKMALSERYRTKKSCRFHLGKNAFFPVMRSIAVRKDAPKTFKETINLRMNDIAQSHLFHRSLETASSNHTKCLTISEPIKLLNRSELQNTFFVWLGGMCLVFLFVAVETVLFKNDVASKRLDIPPIHL